jgi:hypothetical protein
VKYRSAAYDNEDHEHRECNKRSQASEPKCRPLLLGS